MNLTPMEQSASQTLLGIRFWDRLQQRHVADGLLVKAQRLNADRSQRVGKPVTGCVSTGGTIAFFGLHPGERVEATPAKQIWATVPQRHVVAVDMVDVRRRFLPLSFALEVPLDGPGAFKGKALSLSTPLWPPVQPAIEEPVEDPVEEPGVSLWSAPTRPTPDGFALLYAQLVVGAGENPSSASYALVEITQQAPSKFSHFGIADENGTLVLPFPYPPVPDPPDGEYTALQNQDFPLRIKVSYQPDRQKTLPGSQVPNLETILAQNRASIGTRLETGPTLIATDVLEATLRYGTALVLRTSIGSEDPAKTEPHLRIQPA